MRLISPLKHSSYTGWLVSTAGCDVDTPNHNLLNFCSHGKRRSAGRERERHEKEREREKERQRERERERDVSGGREGESEKEEREIEYSSQER